MERFRSEQILKEPIYALGTDRMLTKSQIKDPFSIGPACFALPSGMYTQEAPLEQLIMEYKNVRYAAIIDKFEIMGYGFNMWSKVGIQIRRNGNQQSGDFFLPNLKTATDFYGGIFNYINPSPRWTNVIGFDVRVNNGDALRSFMYNESGTLGYIWIKYIGHYELAEHGDAI